YRCCLARSVDADDKHDMGLQALIECEGMSDGLQNGGNLVGKRGSDFVGGDLLVIPVAGNIGGNPCGGRDAKIGADQQFFELLDHVIIELALGEDVRDAA